MTIMYTFSAFKSYKIILRVKILCTKTNEIFVILYVIIYKQAEDRHLTSWKQLFSFFASIQKHSGHFSLNRTINQWLKEFCWLTRLQNDILNVIVCIKAALFYLCQICLQLRYIKLTHVGFRANVKISSRIVSYDVLNADVRMTLFSVCVCVCVCVSLHFFLQMLQQNNCRTWVKELMVSNSQINSASCCAFKMLLLEKLYNLWLFREDWDFFSALGRLRLHTDWHCHYHWLTNSRLSYALVSHYREFKLDLLLLYDKLGSRNFLQASQK